MSRLALLKRILVACIIVLGAHAAQAQTTPDDPAARTAAPATGFNTDTASVHEQELLSQMRKLQGSITIPDARASMLEQPDGRLWRDYRRGPLLWIAGACVLGMIVLLGLFYVLKGEIKISGGRGIATLLRFSAFERFMHWLTAVSWCILAISGLNVVAGRVVLLPLMGNDAFSLMSAWLKYAHNFLAFPFIAGIILMFLVWLRHNIPNKIDVEWFKQGGGFIGHGHPPAEKFNGGQKIVFWIVMLGGGALTISGLALLFPFYLGDITSMQLAQLAHGGIALAMIAAMLGHIYIGTIGMEGAFDAMKNGEVDLNWAREHHSIWVAEELAKPGDAPPHPAE
jgi:formate dehydrogenase subunit gamma